MFNLWIDLLTSPSWVDRFFAVVPALIFLSAVVLFVAQIFVWRKENKVTAARKAQHAEFMRKVHQPAAKPSGPALWAPVAGSDPKEGFPRGTFVQN